MVGGPDNTINKLCYLETYRIFCCTVALGAASEVDGSFPSGSLSLPSVLTLLDEASPSGVDGVECTGLFVSWILNSGSDGAGGISSGEGLLSGDTDGRDHSSLSETENG